MLFKSNPIKNILGITIFVMFLIFKTVIARSEIWDKNDFIKLPAKNFGATILNNKIYIVGGLNSNQPSKEVSFFDLESKKWTKCASMNYARSNLGVVVLNGKLYAIGGQSGSMQKSTSYFQMNVMGNTISEKLPEGGDNIPQSPELKIVEEYDFQTDKWVEKSRMPIAIKDFGITTFNNKIYVFGGSRFDHIPQSWSFKDQSTNRMFEYDPQTDKWTEKSKMNFSRCQLGTAVVENKLYVLGGEFYGGKIEEPDYKLDNIEEYDPLMDKWSIKSKLPNAISSFGTIVLDNKIYIIGGSESKISEGNVISRHENNILNSTIMYDPKTNLISQLPNMNKPRINFSVLYHGGKIYALGGDDLNSVEELDLIKLNTDPKNGNIQYEYDAKKSQLIYIIKNGKKHIKFNYDSNGNLISQEKFSK